MSSTDHLWPAMVEFHTVYVSTHCLVSQVFCHSLRRPMSRIRSIRSIGRERSTNRQLTRERVLHHNVGSGDWFSFIVWTDDRISRPKRFFRMRELSLVGATEVSDKDRCSCHTLILGLISYQTIRVWGPGYWIRLPVRQRDGFRSTGTDLTLLCHRVGWS